jgi:hypothetical protein
MAEEALKNTGLFKGEYAVDDDKHLLPILIIRYSKINAVEKKILLSGIRIIRLLSILFLYSSKLNQKAQLRAYFQ